MTDTYMVMLDIPLYACSNSGSGGRLDMLAVMVEVGVVLKGEDKCVSTILYLFKDTLIGRF